MSTNDTPSELRKLIDACKILSETNDISEKITEYGNSSGNLDSDVVYKLRDHLFDKSVDLFFELYPNKKVEKEAKSAIKKSKSKK